MKLFEENKTISGFNLRRLLFHQDQHEYIRSLVNKIFDLWRKKEIQPIIDSCWAFEDIPDAMQKMHDRRNVGKITIDPSMEPKPKPVEDESIKKRRSFIKATISEFSSRDSTGGSEKKSESPAATTTTATASGPEKENSEK